MLHPIHVVLDLDCWAGPSTRGRILRGVRSVLRDWSGSVLTLITHRSPPSGYTVPAATRFSEHLITGSGSQLFHHGLTGLWNADTEYPDWHDYHLGKEKSRSAAQEQSERGDLPGLGIALDFLEIFHDTPRPLLVIGDPGRDATVLRRAELALPANVLDWAQAEAKVLNLYGLRSCPTHFARLLSLVYRPPAGRQPSGRTHRPRRRATTGFVPVGGVR